MKLLTFLGLGLVCVGCGWGCATEGGGRGRTERRNVVGGAGSPSTAGTDQESKNDPWSGFFSDADQDPESERGRGRDPSRGRPGGGNRPQEERRRIDPPSDDWLVDNDSDTANQDLGDDRSVTLSRRGPGPAAGEPPLPEAKDRADEENRPPSREAESDGWVRVLKLFGWDRRVMVDPLVDPYDEDSIWIPYVQGQGIEHAAHLPRS